MEATEGLLDICPQCKYRAGLMPHPGKIVLHAERRIRRSRAGGARWLGKFPLLVTSSSFHFPMASMHSAGRYETVQCPSMLSML